MTTMDKDSALQEFGRWADAMRVDLNREGLDENDRNDMDKNRYIIIKALMTGAAMLNENTELVVTPGDPNYSGDPITVHKPKGSAFMAMDKKKSTADFGKLFASIAEITGVNAGVFSQMDAADLEVFRAAWSFLMGM